jgi:chondroitin AC lyase
MRIIVLLLILCGTVSLAQKLRRPGDNHAIPVSAGMGEQDADLEIIRQRVIADLLASPVDENRISELSSTQKADGTWATINYKNVSKTGFQHREHLANILSLSRAFRKSGSPFFNDVKVRSAASKALDFWIDNDFISENWWWNEMGTPELMINILLVLDTDLTPRQRMEGVRIAGRANMEASGARPGGDLIQIAGMRGKQALFQRNPEVLSRVIAVMATEIKTSSGRGLKPDLSFHHRTDNVISTLGYGMGYADSFAYWASKIAGTKYTLPEPAMHLLIDYYLDGICQSMVYGKFPDPGAENRGITRKEALEIAGNDLPENLLAAGSYRKAELENIIKIRRGEVKPALTRDYYFWHSHYYTHQRPDYYTSVRMHSNRASNMEQPHNEEGLKSHHYGDGSNFISVTGEEYRQIFPVWDWQKIPGTTVLQKPDVVHWNDLARQGRKDFTGGVTDEKYGTAAFDFESVHDPLKAKKAWFFFDSEFVCLGAGIQSDADLNVATTLNQSLLNGAVTVKADNKHQLEPDLYDLKNVNWVHHANIGYVFPDKANVKLRNQSQTGTWRSINHQSWATDEPVTKEVFTLWLDHGRKPQSGSYQYIVVPGVSEAAMNTYRSDLLKIISNTEQMQAVEHTGLGLSQIVFYQPGIVKLGDNLNIKADQPCLVMVTHSNSKVQKVTVSDPTGKLKKIRLELNTRLNGAGGDWQNEWDENRKVSVLQFSLPEEGMAGKSVSALLTE